MSKMKTSNILVVGDIMLDIYFNGEVNRISPEAPVPVFKKKTERAVLGGAANVAANLIAANQKAGILACIGEDPYGQRMRELFSEIGIDCSLLVEWDRPTITKTRFLAENNQQVLRLDVEDSRPIQPLQVDELLQSIEAHIDRYNLIIVSDYMKGLLTYEFVQGVIDIAKKSCIKVLVDVKDPDYSKYRGAWLLKPNLKELNMLTKMSVNTDEELLRAARFLLKKSESEYVLTTCGAKGMVLVGKDIVYQLDTVGKSVYDVTGAGDTTIAYLAASLANGDDIIDAMRTANYAAGIQVGKVGTSAVYYHEVEEARNKNGIIKKKKIFRLNERKELAEVIAEWKHKKERIVTTNGCFDIIHRGHISLLEEAKTYGEHLIVMINSDESVKRLKGPSRPINTAEDRAAVIAALDCVDAVVLFDPMIDNGIIPSDDLVSLDNNLKRVAEEAPMGIMRLIRPNVHVKGGDYTVSQVPEAIYADEFKAVHFVKGYSTTKTIERSQKA